MCSSSGAKYSGLSRAGGTGSRKLAGLDGNVIVIWVIGR